MRKRQLWALALIVALACVLRFWDLGRIPSGFTADEAGAGYNAFSLLHTGRDRHGERLPLYVNNFGDFIEATYSYLAVPGVAAMGLDEFSSRFPAAVAGVLTVPALYGLGTRLLGPRVGMVAAGLLAISPWNIQISRHAGSRPLLSLAFCLGLLAFLHGLGRPRWLLVSAFIFAASLYTYPSARVFLPLFLLGLSALYGRSLLTSRRYETIAAIALLFLLSLPGATHWVSPEGLGRARFVVDDSGQWLPQYLSYFSPDFLFLQGDPNIRHSLAGWLGSVVSLRDDHSASGPGGPVATGPVEKQRSCCCGSLCTPCRQR